MLVSACLYSKGNGPADPRYCKGKELYLLPEGAPRPTKDNMAKLWRVHAPDRFDCFSAGCTMMQLAVPGLRDEAAFDAFMKELEANGWGRRGSRREVDARGKDGDGGDIE